jgi:hypothetical protein
MTTLYAPVDVGTVIGLDGNEYRIRGGIIDVPEQDVDGLLANGFMRAVAVEVAVEVTEDVKKPVRKGKKETTE